MKYSNGDTLAGIIGAVLGLLASGGVIAVAFGLLLWAVAP